MVNCFLEKLGAQMQVQLMVQIRWLTSMMKICTHTKYPSERVIASFT
jgi:hypothetical protein